MPNARNPLEFSGKRESLCRSAALDHRKCGRARIPGNLTDKETGRTLKRPAFDRLQRAVLGFP
jgi:hypothetical protein